MKMLILGRPFECSCGGDDFQQSIKAGGYVCQQCSKVHPFESVLAIRYEEPQREQQVQHGQ